MEDQVLLRRKTDWETLYREGMRRGLLKDEFERFIDLSEQTHAFCGNPVAPYDPAAVLKVLRKAGRPLAISQVSREIAGSDDYHHKRIKAGIRRGINSNGATGHGLFCWRRERTGKTWSIIIACTDSGKPIRGFSVDPITGD